MTSSRHDVASPLLNLSCEHFSSREKGGVFGCFSDGSVVSVVSCRHRRGKIKTTSVRVRHGRLIDEDEKRHEIQYLKTYFRYVRFELDTSKYELQCKRILPLSTGKIFHISCPASPPRPRPLDPGSTER